VDTSYGSRTRPTRSQHEANGRCHHLFTLKISISGLVFGEAIDDQQLLCDRLAAAALWEPLSEADYLERENLMDKQVLAQDNGVRTWCLYRSDSRTQVLAASKTVKRQLLVTNIHGAHTGNGYCIISVITHPEHRGRGYASALLRNVAEWLDWPGDALASMLYSNKEAVSNCYSVNDEN
jgi:GNAT superfamily N-acetyltransferase